MCLFVGDYCKAVELILMPRPDDKEYVAKARQFFAETRDVNGECECEWLWVCECEYDCDWDLITFNYNSKFSRVKD